MNANEILERRKLQRINQNHEEQQTERSNRKPSFSNPANFEKDLPKEKIQAENEPKEDSPRTIHLRWEKMRVQWMNKKETERDTPYKCASRPVPTEKRELRNIVETMRSYIPPYEAFPAFYKLQDVIDLYEQIWYEEDSDF
eukprot:TRINITY_DN817_c0_g1_i2.p1 TRINITY_DN817_c0_g1~~TRINITY_DN817_c0_g1_i2.p1  ORF type:complete len:141 (-),score=12.96 TRINITY_DN817_c0_g1_i2:153-575(-)